MFIKIEILKLIYFQFNSGKHLAVGTNSSTVQLWDVTRQKQLREMRGHDGVFKYVYN